MATLEERTVTGVSFGLTDEQKALRDLAHEFADREIRPKEREYDEHSTHPADLIETAHGTHREAFGLFEWGLLTSVALIWGASFLFIDIGLEHFGPGVVAFGRVFAGAVTLWLIPGSHRPVEPPKAADTARSSPIDRS